MALGVGFGLARLFGFTGTERGVVVLMCLMPVSVGMIPASTLLTCLPLLMVLAFGL